MLDLQVVIFKFSLEVKERLVLIVGILKHGHVADAVIFLKRNFRLLYWGFFYLLNFLLLLRTYLS